MMRRMHNSYARTHVGGNIRVGDVSWDVPLNPYLGRQLPLPTPFQPQLRPQSPPMLQPGRFPAAPPMLPNVPPANFVPSGGPIPQLPPPVMMSPPPAMPPPAMPPALMPPGSLDGCNSAPNPWYDQWCQYNAANYEHAAKAAIAAKQPQIGLGLRNNSVAALTAGINVTATPSVPLCITDFEVSRVSSPFFLITALRAARTDFLADGVGIPADAFSPDSDHPPLEMPYLMPGTNVTVTVENIAADPHPFFATFWGIPGGHPGPCL